MMNFIKSHYKHTLLLFFLLLPLCVNAQRTVRNTYGIEVNAGIPLFRNGQIDFTNNKVIEAGVIKYRAHSNYYNFSLYYQERTGRYMLPKEKKEIRIPVQHLTINAGHNWRLFSDLGSNVFLYAHLTAIAGWELLNRGDKKLPDERTLLRDSHFIGGFGTGLSFEAFLSDNVALTLKPTMRVIWGSDLKYFHPSVQTGIRVNF